MTSTRLAALALFLSVMALIVVFMAPSESPRAREQSSKAAARPIDLGGRLDGLSKRMKQLEAELEALQLQQAPALSKASSNAELERRLRLLEQGASEPAETRQAPRKRPKPVAEAPLERSADAPKTLDDWADQARNPSSTPAEQLAALKQLRGQRLADGSDARLAVLPEMLHLAQASEDGALRAEVWRQLNGLKDPGLQVALLDALASDSNARVREGAADSLGAFLPDPGVEDALRFAQENDADPGVQKQAAASLARAGG